MRLRWRSHIEEKLVGLPGFEPGSNGPKPSSIGQTNPQARE